MRWVAVKANRSEFPSCGGVVRVPRRVFQRLLPERLTPERCVEAYYLQRTRFEGAVERKLRRRQLTEDGNAEINWRSGRPTAGGERLQSTLSGHSTRRMKSELMHHRTFHHLHNYDFWDGLHRRDKPKLVKIEI